MCGYKFPMGNFASPIDFGQDSPSAAGVGIVVGQEDTCSAAMCVLVGQEGLSAASVGVVGATSMPGLWTEVETMPLRVALMELGSQLVLSTAQAPSPIYSLLASPDAL
jgi:hypothetical protein